MNFCIVFYLLTLGSLWAAPAPSEVVDILSKILKEHKELLPSEVVEAYASLSDADKAIIKEVFKSDKVKNEKDFISALKEKSPELGERAEKLYEKLQKRISGLPEEPRKFVTALIEAGRVLHRRHVAGEKIQLADVKSFLNAQYDGFKKLSDESKQELREAFPGITKFLQDDKVKAQIAKILGDK